MLHNASYYLKTSQRIFVQGVNLATEVLSFREVINPID